MEDEPLNTDELIAAMERDEVEGATHLSPRDFAKSIGVAPQLVYYYIRTGKIEATTCLCGRKVIEVEQARQVFESRGSYINKEPDA